MADAVHSEAVAEVPHLTHEEILHQEEVDLFNPQPMMVGLTWLTFLLVTIVLYKVAWKPILQALDKREETIRESLENAAKARAELEDIENRRNEIIGEADAKATEIVATAKQAAVDLAGSIEESARKEAEILVENARREIRTEQDKAMAALRKESANLAIDLTRRILEDQLNEEKGRQLADDMLKRI